MSPNLSRNDLFNLNGIFNVKDTLIVWMTLQKTEIVTRNVKRSLITARKKVFYCNLSANKKGEYTVMSITRAAELRTFQSLIPSATVSGLRPN